MVSFHVKVPHGGEIFYISDGNLHCVLCKLNSCDEIRVQILGSFPVGLRTSPMQQLARTHTLDPLQAWLSTLLCNCPIRVLFQSQLTYLSHLGKMAGGTGTPEANRH